MIDGVIEIIRKYNQNNRVLLNFYLSLLEVV